jgi:hypothetical protein
MDSEDQPCHDDPFVTAGMVHCDDFSLAPAMALLILSIVLGSWIFGSSFLTIFVSTLIGLVLAVFVFRISRAVNAKTDARLCAARQNYAESHADELPDGYLVRPWTEQDDPEKIIASMGNTE